MNGKTEITLLMTRIQGIVVRRWRWILLGIGLAALIGTYRFFSAPRIYQAQSQVLLSSTTAQILGRRVESVSNPGSEDGPQPNILRLNTN